MNQLSTGKQNGNGVANRLPVPGVQTQRRSSQAASALIKLSVSQVQILTILKLVGSSSVRQFRSVRSLPKKVDHHDHVWTRASQ